MKLLAAALCTLALAACGNQPPVPDWQLDGRGALDRAVQAWLTGNSRMATAEFERARQALAATGRPALVARAELLRCAAQVASLDFSPCERFEALRADAEPAELAYAAYLQGQPADAKRLDTADPLGRLVAAGVLLRAGQASPATVALAVDTASAQGWRRPLLAWLGVQRQRALAAGDGEMAARLQRRMDLVAPP